MAGRRNWMLALARHSAHLRSADPTDRLSVVFEIDGPIVDQPHLVRRRLLDYDRVHWTDHFRGVEVAKVEVDAGTLNAALSVEACPRWSAELSSIDTGSNLRHRSTCPGTERPYPGVLKVICWFQL